MSATQGSGTKALLRDYRRFAGPRLWLAFGLMVAGAAAEGFGILMIVPLAALAAGSDAGAFARFSSLAQGLSSDQRFFAALGLFVGAMAARSALLYVRDRQLARLQAGYEASLKLRSAATLASRGWPFASRMGQAGMQSLLLTDVPRAATAIAQAQLFAVSSVMLVVQFALAALLSVTLAAVALAIVLAGSLLSLGWTRRGVRSGLKLVERFEESAGSGFRLHAGLKAALAQGTVPQFLGEYRSTLDSAKREVARFYIDVSAARSLAFLASAMAAALLLFVGVRLLAVPFAVLVTSLVLFARMATPAQQLQQSAQNIGAFAPSFGAIERRLGPLAPPGAERAGPAPLDWSELRVDGAGYEHQPGLGITGASFTLARGQWLGLGGPSGSGKTTLIDLIAGLLEPGVGALMVDGKPLSGETLDRWRAALGYVGQEGSVFDDSVRGNLLADGAAAEDGQLWQALDTAGLAPRVRAFAGGLDERVGDRGSQLSGGERQRLAIARALLRRPSLLILDEATAALDAASEGELLERLRALEPRPAAIIVAHRSSTLAYCDSLLSIQHGKIG